MRPIGSRTITARWNGPGPPPDLSRVPRPVWLPADDEIGVSAGTRAVLLSDERRALALVDCVAYSKGFEFTISYRSRDDVPPRMLHIHPPSSPFDELSVSIVYHDGARAASVEHGIDAMRRHYQAAYEGKDPPMPAGPIVMPQRGGGGGKRYEYSFWCWPLPPEGRMTLTVQWDRADIPSTTVEIDTSAIRQAGLSSGKLWTE
jgi:hypothetical protein